MRLGLVAYHLPAIFGLVRVNKVQTSLVGVESRKATSSVLWVLMINGRIIGVKVNST
jgi:hypothetical protein